MRHVSPVRSAALAGSILVLLSVFVLYRARTFHYCAGYETRNPRVSIVGANQSCGKGEESTAFTPLWQAEGLRTKFKTIGQMFVQAFVPE